MAGGGGEEGFGGEGTGLFSGKRAGWESRGTQHLGESPHLPRTGGGKHISSQTEGQETRKCCRTVHREASSPSLLVGTIVVQALNEETPSKEKKQRKVRKKKDPNEAARVLFKSVKGGKTTRSVSRELARRQTVGGERGPEKQGRDAMPCHQELKKQQRGRIKE